MNSDAEIKYTKNGITLHYTVTQDEYCESPLEGHYIDFVSLMRNFNSTDDGNKYFKPELGEYPQYLLRKAMKNGNVKKYVPVTFYSHGGVDLNLGEYNRAWPDQQWDCGVAGYLYVSAEQYRNMFGSKQLRTTSDRIMTDMKSLVGQLTAYLNGDVYCVKLEVFHKGKCIYENSCDGVYDVNEMKRYFLFEVISQNQLLMSDWDDVEDKLFYRRL